MLRCAAAASQASRASVILFVAAAWTQAVAPTFARAEHPTDLNNRGITEAQAGRFEQGAGYLREALQRDPSDRLIRRNLSGILTDWAGQLIQQNEASRAEPLLEEAVELNGENGLALVRLGDLAYQARSQFERAVTLWTRAHGHIPDAAWPAVANRISQAQRDQLVERTFVSERTAHFEMRLPRRDPAAIDTLRTVLEREYEELAFEFGTEPSAISVIIYPEHELRRLYNQRDWTIGFYDGRLRLRATELHHPHFRVLVAHELAHAFLHRVYGARMPLWVHEGYAQWRERLAERTPPPEDRPGGRVRRPEGPRTPQETQLERRVRDRTAWVPLKWLDRHFTQPTGTEDIQRAYVQARVVVEELARRHGIPSWHAFCRRLSEGASIEKAYDEVFSPSQWSRLDQGIFD